MELEDLLIGGGDVGQIGEGGLAVLRLDGGGAREGAGGGGEGVQSNPNGNRPPAATAS